MIRDIRPNYYQKLIVSFILILTVGYLFGAPWLWATMAVTGYLFWILYQQHRLVSWLVSGSRKTPPDSSGLWGLIFDHLYRVQRDHRDQIREYRGVLKRIRSSTEALSDGIIILDANGGIQWWNSAARDLLNLRKNDHGQLLTNLIRDPSFIKYYNRHATLDPITLENPAQQQGFIQISLTVYGEGERLLFLRDVTRLTQLEQMRQDFVANASHELKTPITVLKGHLENILSFSENLAPPIEKALNTMNNQTLRMANLVNDLLLLTRLDSEHNQTDHAINLPSFIEQAAADASELSASQNHNIVIDCQSDYWLRGSRSEVRSALNNLVFNAVNYSPAGTTVTISWHKTKRGAVLSVTDEGEGIEQHHIPRLTERFYRVDPGRSSEQGGTGLGLAITKHALARHEARLDIRSEKGKGSTFSCMFPESRLLSPEQVETEYSN
ncbi:phosphate regulon sensor histidine kinase PhoR [Reinekea thalattae]|uniref:Phosphate regulon sensor protein PhoR n=1 Tax=Reinekea thalattae TaxID=2593301 RepID=A0A5C8Z024_9GAMM|nr:phosphate regulon sensor histidine kinase PhoR [Reinekea thalattae]TXR51482.1 phosphate regulon sensor histidine kinase PhoR [Reinekea thalattae]